MEERKLGRAFFITGAESTGKSTLTGQLAAEFSGIGVPEYARTYLELHGRNYDYHDLEEIARYQLRLITQNSSAETVFYDTCLINLKVWFNEVFQRTPEWLTEAIPVAGRGIYLVCQPDLPWQFDPLRENPHRRDYLNELYEKDINEAGFEYFRVFGTGNERLTNAIRIVKKCIEFEPRHQ